MRQQIIIAKEKGGKEAPVAQLFPSLTGKEIDDQPIFGQWLLSLSGPPPELKIGKVREAALNRLQLGRLYLMEENPQSAHQHFLAAVTLAPSYWKTWRYLGRSSSLLDRQQDSARGYEKALALIDRCNKTPAPNCEDAPKQDQEYRRILYGAGYAHLNLANYDKAADFLTKALQFAPESYQQMVVEWLAIARFAGHDLNTSWQQYLRLLESRYQIFMKAVLLLKILGSLMIRPPLLSK